MNLSFIKIFQTVFVEPGLREYKYIGCFFRINITKENVRIRTEASYIEVNDGQVIFCLVV